MQQIQVTVARPGSTVGSLPRIAALSHAAAAGWNAVLYLNGLRRGARRSARCCEPALTASAQ